MTDPEVRLLREDELPLAPPLLAPEGWAFSVDELARLRRLGGAVGAFDGPRLVGYLSFVDHGPVRWIGNVVVDASLRGRGAGARMVALACEGAPATGLYAVEKAVTLYARLGFVARGEVVAHRAAGARARGASDTQPMRRDDLPDAARLDREATGMDRAPLLRELLAAYPASARVARRAGRLDGFGFAKTSPEVTDVGPLVARDAATAEGLLDALLAATPSPHEAAAHGENGPALAALRDRGFAPAFRAVTMFRGPPPAWDPRAMALISGLEKG